MAGLQTVLHSIDYAIFSSVVIFSLSPSAFLGKPLFPAPPPQDLELELCNNKKCVIPIIKCSKHGYVSCKMLTWKGVCKASKQENSEEKHKLQQEKQEHLRKAQLFCGELRTSMLHII